MNFYYNKKKAFTLFELLTVIFIISLIGSMALIYFLRARSLGEGSKKISEISSFQIHLEDYLAIEGSYPELLIPGEPLVGSLSGIVFSDKTANNIDYYLLRDDYYEIEFELDNKVDSFDSGFNLLTPRGHSTNDVGFHSSKHHLYFNGIDNRINSNKNIDFDINAGDYSASAWIYVDNEEIMNWQTVIGVGVQYTMGFHLYANRICTYGDLTAFCVNFNSFISRNSWHFISAVHDYDNKKITTYVDGVKVSERVYGLNLVNTINRPVTSGYRGTYTGDLNYFKGYIYDARIYKRALSSDEIIDLYESKKISRKDLLVRWQMNEGIGCVVKDNSINNIDGNLLIDCPESSPVWIPNVN